MDIVLIAGLWLDGSAWDDVLPELEKLGHRGIPLTLPGQGDGATSATYDDQVAAVVAAVDAAEGRPLVVGHSAACTLAWAAADLRPDAVAGVALIGGFPSTEGEKYADFFEPVDGVMPFPGWEKFEGPDSDDMSDELKESLLGGMIAVPVGVTRGVVHWTSDARHGVPLTLVCPEFSPAEAQEWIDAGDVPELGAATALELVDIDSGHWPMYTQPAALADLLDGAVRR
ncbi:Pimeloyl-ACP methyl ester carboxylesterase [Nocardioides exalbidus]|uniref:Pimeloyl-ACP methyl ester carboxylesterase n=1 Tax=Nocardioides exalbidus TaxID=402596 RepID=A0A1H4PF53_9ACTN|nr:alpha/beta hydrolase [Nocardioides exalbidus]SEC06020.1 Pimeloyl-ACP methyl ester carboxylesterase [Nocardioides exalbidus]